MHDLIEISRRKETSPDSVAFSELASEELQLREHLQAGNLLLRSYIILFSDIIAVQEKTPVGIRGILKVDFTINRTFCDEIIAEAKISGSVRQEAEAQVLWAKLAAMECGVLAVDREGDESGNEQRAKDLNMRAVERLTDVDDTCARHLKKSDAHIDHLRRTRLDLVDEAQTDPLESVAKEAREVRRMLREGVSSSEMRMVVAAMQKEFGGTGHWYRCANGHPFTVGECGMPMQLARCPECGAGVGGQGHVSTEGVTHARDIDEMIGGLTL